MFVKITKCSSSKFWYKDKIGTIIEVDDNCSDYMTLDPIDEEGNYGFINVDDCKVINED